MSEEETSPHSDTKRGAEKPWYPPEVEEEGELLTLSFSRGDGSKENPYIMRPAEKIDNAIFGASVISMAARKDVHFKFQKTQLRVSPALEVDYSDPDQETTSMTKMALETARAATDKLSAQLKGE